MLTHCLNIILEGRDLSAAESGEIFELLVSEEVPQVQLAAFLTALRMKGESLGELLGAARMLRRHAEHPDCFLPDVVDTCGTGGDGSSSFNISTTASFIASGAGVRVAKHGNRAVSGKCGSADLMEALGLNLNMTSGVMERSLAENGIGFFFAPRMHPVLGKFAKLRRELKIRTIFNMLGPLCNPAGASCQVLGVYAPQLTELFAGVLRELGSRHVLVVHGSDGLDEISCCAATRVSELKNGVITTYDLYPELYLGRTYHSSELKGGDAFENAKIAYAVLSGEDRGARRAVCVLNAGAAIYVAGIAGTLQEGICAAEESIDSGRALEKLDCLMGVAGHE